MEALAAVPSDEAAGGAGAYRRDVDGLRAVAIVPVLLFHAGWQHFAGGFIGVDVFFVISGFLITGVIAREIAAGRFSIAKFYARRAKRILPALFAVLAATLATGMLLLGPSAMRDLGQSVVATAVSVSNVVFWKGTDYFASSAELKPLLMTWSLGVEEQFYALWPLALVVAVRWRVAPAILVLLLAATSFAISWWGVHHRPEATFYLLPTRAWELLAGAALAKGIAWQTRSVHASRMRDAVSIAGLLLIVFAIAAFDKDTPFPGPAALVPCIGTAFLIWAGERAVVNRLLLSSRPLVFVGLISYSLYLWHWPVICFVRIMHVGSLPIGPAIAALAVAFGLAYLSWRFIERPFRRPSTLPHASVLWRYGTATGAVALLGGIVWATDGLPQRVSHEVARADAARTDTNPLHLRCRNQSAEEHLPKPDCVIGSATGGGRVALWGDSHADAFAPAIQAWAVRNGHGFVQITSSNCPPLTGVQVVRGARTLEECAAFATRALEAVTRDPRVDVVVLAARWPYLTESTGFGEDLTVKRYLTDAVSDELTRANSRRAFIEALQRVTSALTDAGKSVIGPIPEVGVDVPDCLVRAGMPFGVDRRCSAPTDLITQRLRFATEAIEKTVRDNTGVKAFQPARELCSNGECLTKWEGRSLYVDDDHLSRVGALFLGERLEIAVASSPRR
jgi:peptidoglycan/LPS O-acetylase OafA/YrhL